MFPGAKKHRRIHHIHTTPSTLVFRFTLENGMLGEQHTHEAAAPPPPQEGGRTYGEGVKGMTLDVPCIRRDANTLCAYVEKLYGGDHPVELCKVTMHVSTTPSSSSSSSSQSKKKYVLHGLEAWRMITETIPTNASKGKYIAKIFKGTEAAAGFKREVVSMHELVSVYKGHVREYTTVGGVSDGRGHMVIGMEIEMTASSSPTTYVALSKRCDKSAEKLHFDDRSALRFARDALQSLSILHAGGMVHGDIKLDNLIYCADDDKYKLIDWELADTTSILAARYLKHRKPKNYASPLSWYTWGIDKYSSITIFMLYYFYKHAGWVLRGNSHSHIRDELWDVARSFKNFMLRPDISKLSRRTLLQRYAHTFDTFNLGIILMWITKSAHISPGVRTVLSGLATRMCQYDHDEFFPTTRDAIRWLDKQEGGRGKAASGARHAEK